MTGNVVNFAKTASLTVQTPMEQPAPDQLPKGGEPPTFSGMERLARMEAVVERIEKDLDGLKTDGKETRRTIWITAIGSTIAVIACVVGVWQAGLASQANLLAAFQSGLSAIQSSASQQSPTPTVINVQPAPVTILPPPAPAAPAPVRP